MPLSNITETSTFRQWYENHNLVVNFLNQSVVSDNTTVYGTFVIGAAANTSLLVANNLLVNSTAVRLSGNTTLAANVTVTSAANTVNFAPGQFLVQPANGTIFNSAITVNSTSLFLSTVAVNAAMTVNSTMGITGNTTVNGTSFLTGVHSRQVLFTAANSAVANTMADPQYNDFDPTGLADCQLLNLTPTINTVVTGLAAPNITSGSRVLYVQNLATAYKISFPSGNTASLANNRIKTTNDITFDLQPGAAATLIWAHTNKQWRLLSAAAQGGEQSFGNTTITGSLSVSANASFAANVFVSRLTANVSVTTVALTATGTTTLAGMSASGNTTFLANSAFSATTRMNGRLVIPVGTNLYAT